MKSKGLWVLLAALLLLALPACNTLNPPAPTPLPTVVLDGSNPSAGAAPDASLPVGGVTASGVIVPAQLAQLAFPAGGSVQEVSVASGDKVQQGQVLVRLSGSEKLAAAVEAANLELLSAQQALADLQDNAEQARAQAQLRLAQAKDAYDTAQKHRGWKQYRVGSDDQIAVARADLTVAQDRVDKAEEAYNGLSGDPEANVTKAAALSALAAARTARDRAQANLNYLLSIPNSIDVDKAEGELQVAKAELDAAQSEFDKLQNGPNPEALALIQARIQNAQAQLTAAQASLADVELKAPFDGVVSKLNLVGGEWVLPGQVILTLADLDHLRVETTDLSERDVPQIGVGQPVTVVIKALGQNVSGRVAEISPLADTLGGDVVYTTWIDLDSLPTGLRAGMSVDVRFGE